MYCYAQGQDSDRAARSLDQAGVSTSTHVMLDMKTDLGGQESGSLHASCVLDATSNQAALQKVSICSKDQCITDHLIVHMPIILVLSSV